jgi:hypothetical protein
MSKKYVFDACSRKEVTDMGVPATKIEFEKELQRRRKEQDLLQTKLDVDELNRRVKAVEKGQSKLIDSEEVWTKLKEMEYI